jgi:hypothetical protein
MIVVRELTTNRITRIIENMLIWLPWGSESATVIATITNVRNSVTENDVLSPELPLFIMTVLYILMCISKESLYFYV